MNFLRAQGGVDLTSLYEYYQGKIKRRAEAAGLPYSTCCHTFRATGITPYL